MTLGKENEWPNKVKKDEILTFRAEYKKKPSTKYVFRIKRNQTAISSNKSETERHDKFFVYCCI